MQTITLREDTICYIKAVLSFSIIICVLSFFLRQWAVVTIHDRKQTRRLKASL